MATFTKTVSKIEEAYDIIKAYIDLMDSKQREEWWEGEDDHPADKLAKLCEELMPGYKCEAFVNYYESESDCNPIEDVASTLAGILKTKQSISDIQYCDFDFDECQNTWTNHYDTITIIAVK